MTRSTYETLCSALIASFVCAAPLACGSSNSYETGYEAVAGPVATPAPAAESAPTSAPASVAAPTPVVEPELVIDEAPVLASATTPSIELAIEHADVPELTRKAQPSDSLRSPTLLPPGTPEANIAAFTNLRIGHTDKRLVGGVGASGIHLDELEVGKGWESSRCADLGSTFVAGVDERVNVCLRVVHPREQEVVTLEWARDGKLRQSIDLHIASTHAYLTRAWMPVTAGRAGHWTATVKSADGAVLGQVAFEIGG